VLVGNGVVIVLGTTVAPSISRLARSLNRVSSKLKAIFVVDKQKYKGVPSNPMRQSGLGVPRMTDEAMHVCLYLDRSRTFRWHLWLTEALVAIPNLHVTMAFSPEKRPLPRSCTVIFETERFVYRLKRTNAIDPVDAPQIERLTAASAGPFDLVIDFAADESVLPACKRVLTPCFNSIPGEIGAIAGLVSEPPLLMDLHDSARPAAPWSARPATDHVFVRSLDNTLSCAVGLIVKAATTPVATSARSFYARSKSSPLPRVMWSAALQTTGTIADKVAKYIKNLVAGDRGWSVAWRFDPSYTLLDRRSATFSVLADDEKRYYADPFPFRYNGQDFVFVEEFSYASGRGCISVALIKDSVASTPFPVLEEPHHLSYPFIFTHANQVWMIPESGEARGVYLYRAEQFPYRWKREACLINRIEAYDATLLRHAGRFWLFVCERICNSSSWDILSLFHTDNVTGPWLPAHNPVLVDAMMSRPAGAIIQRHGHKIRPTQDCSREYGGAVPLYRVDKLEPDEFSQVLIGTIHCGSRGCHTYNNYSGLEVIDVFGRKSGSEVHAFFDPLIEQMPTQTGQGSGSSPKDPSALPSKRRYWKEKSLGAGNH
jgi:hypothetical protein